MNNKKFHQLALEKIQPVLNLILNHEFIKQLGSGTLEKKIFEFYVLQDKYFLEVYSRCNAAIAARIKSPHMVQFINYARDSLIEEINSVHNKFLQHKEMRKEVYLSPAAKAYTDHLLSSCFSEPIEVAISSIVPCAWIYHQVGYTLSKHLISHHPYAFWITTYSDPNFGNTSLELLHLIDELVKGASLSIKKQMIHNFYISAVYEFKFWDDAYKMSLLNPFIKL